MTKLSVLLLAVSGFQSPRFEEGLPSNKITMEIGFRIQAGGSGARSVSAQTAFPRDWPEQTVKIISEDVSDSARHLLREVETTGRLLQVNIKRLGPGETAHALLQIEVVRRPQRRADLPRNLVVPEDVPAQVKRFLTASPGIESTSVPLRRLAKEFSDFENRLDQIRRVQKWTFDHIKYVPGDFKGCLAALADKSGDCEERTAVFVALCRANGVPARSVWVPGHTYAEFYYEDAEQKGGWCPVQSVGATWVGTMPADAVVMQKGDRFRIPSRRGREQHYLTDWAKSIGRVTVTFVSREIGREPLSDSQSSRDENTPNRQR